MNLWSLEPGDSGIVISLETLQGPLKDRLIDLGIRKGELVLCSHWSPFGGPRAYKLALGHFALEKEIAESILIEG